MRVKPPADVRPGQSGSDHQQGAPQDAPRHQAFSNISHINIDSLEFATALRGPNSWDAPTIQPASQPPFGLQATGSRAPPGRANARRGLAAAGRGGPARSPAHPGAVQGGAGGNGEGGGPQHTGPCQNKYCKRRQDHADRLLVQRDAVQAKFRETAKKVAGLREKADWTDKEREEVQLEWDKLQRANEQAQRYEAELREKLASVEVAKRRLYADLARLQAEKNRLAREEQGRAGGGLGAARRKDPGWDTGFVHPHRDGLELCWGEGSGSSQKAGAAKGGGRVAAHSGSYQYFQADRCHRWSCCLKQTREASGCSPRAEPPRPDDSFIDIMLSPRRRKSPSRDANGNGNLGSTRAGTGNGAERQHCWGAGETEPPGSPAIRRGGRARDCPSPIERPHTAGARITGRPSFWDDPQGGLTSPLRRPGSTRARSDLLRSKPWASSSVHSPHNRSQGGALGFGGGLDGSLGLGSVTAWRPRSAVGVVTVSPSTSRPKTAPLHRSMPLAA